MKTNLVVASTIMLSTLLTSCGGSGGDNALSCPDYVEYTDPLVKIASVVDASRNEQLIQVNLSELRIDGMSADFSGVKLGPAQSYNIDVSTDGLSAVCTIPCGLFTKEGEYTMVFSAPSFEAKRVDFKPSYRERNTQNCPTTYKGSYELKVTLSPEGLSIP